MLPKRLRIVWIVLFLMAPLVWSQESEQPQGETEHLVSDPPNASPPTQPEPSAESLESTPIQDHPVEQTTDFAVETKEWIPVTELVPLVQGPYQNIANYDIEVQLDPDKKRLHVRKQVLTYTNASPDIIDELQFHLYLNAFKDTASNHYRENPHASWEPKTAGYLEIQKIWIAGTDVTTDQRFVVKEHGEPGDQTVMALPLRQPLMPGESIQVEMAYEAQLPLVTDRTGYQDDFFMVAQWFPKLGVWETKGFRGAKQAGWNCHHFHAHSEFFANFGHYRVAISVPDDFVVGATGSLQIQKEIDGGTTYVYEQDRVHDFAFTASPHFIRVARTFRPEEWVSEQELDETMARFGIDRDQAKLESVEMILLLQPKHRHQLERHFKALGLAIKEFGLAYGRYPYQTITLVDPPESARSTAGGMEYPTFFAAGSRMFMPKDDLDLEEVIVHEYAHQYFYGLLGTNEFEEAWLDEGFTEWATSSLIKKEYGGQAWIDYQWPIPISRSDILGVRKTDPFGMMRASLHGERPRQAPVQPAWSYPSYRSYAVNTYTKPALLLEQLRLELGDPVFAKVMRTYVQEWSYRHPSADDFFALVSRVAERDMSAWFDKMFRRPGYVDYAVAPIKSRSWDEDPAAVDDDSQPAAAANERLDRQTVQVLNLGTTDYPQELKIVFADGSERRENWDGIGTQMNWVYDDMAKITLVELDPDRKVVVDTNPINNSFRTEPIPEVEAAWRAHLFGRVQNLLHFLTGGL